jgi:hypothetical protein
LLDNSRRPQDILCGVQKLDELLIRDYLVPPDVKTRVVYHYTSAAGLMGILDSGSIRGTNAAFLNDTSEIAYGLSVCVAVLEEERSSRKSAVEQQLLDRTLGFVRDDASPYEIYVASFSARRDVLSQWRGYGSAAGRYCIAFQLAQFSERDILRLPHRVEYALTDQRELVKRAIVLACRTVIERPDDNQDAWSCVTALTFHLRRLMCSFKHPGFAEEEEWRSIATVRDEDLVVGFEAVKGLPRPYIRMLEGSRTSGRLPVVEVCVGPAERKQVAIHATRLLLSRYGYGNAAVTHTDIPFAP